jgi:hypothetical protein
VAVAGVSAGRERRGRVPAAARSPRGLVCRAGTDRSAAFANHGRTTRRVPRTVVVALACDRGWAGPSRRGTGRSGTGRSGTGRSGLGRTCANGAHRPGPQAPPARADIRVTRRATHVVPGGDSASGVPVRSPSTTCLPRRAQRGCPAPAHGVRLGWTLLLLAWPLAIPESAVPFYSVSCATARGLRGAPFKPCSGQKRSSWLRRGAGAPSAAGPPVDAAPWGRCSCSACSCSACSCSAWSRSASVASVSAGGGGAARTRRSRRRPRRRCPPPRRRRPCRTASGSGPAATPGRRRSAPASRVVRRSCAGPCRG